MRTTSKCIKHFCTVHRGCSRLTTMVKPMRKKLRKRWHVATHDAAAEELCASDLMRSSKKLAPNLKLCNRDTGHASGRVVARPWHADKDCKRVVRNFALSKRSPAQMLQNSDDLKSFFRPILSETLPGNNTWDLQAAKHRYQKYQKPMVRSCRLFLALVKFCLWVFHHRTGKQKKRARRWLLFVVSTGCFFYFEKIRVFKAGICLNITLGIII